jgi:hypothetical protein
MNKSITTILISGVLSLALTACSTTGTSPTSNSTEEANSSKITQEELTKITKGMELEEVIEIIGGEGKQQGESGKPGTKAYQATFVWDGASPHSFVSISFRNNKVSTIQDVNIK